MNQVYTKYRVFLTFKEKLLNLETIQKQFRFSIFRNLQIYYNYYLLIILSNQISIHLKTTIRKKAILLNENLLIFENCNIDYVLHRSIKKYVPSSPSYKLY